MSLPEAIVQMAIPRDIIATDMYLCGLYLLCMIIIPKIMFAIKDPYSFIKENM